MSLDYPFYEELCKRKHRAARWWLIGDRLYYLGLLPALLAMAGAPVALVVALFDDEWWRLWACLIAFPVGAIVFYVGASLKRYAYIIAEKDGITSQDVWPADDRELPPSRNGSNPLESQHESNSRDN